MLHGEADEELRQARVLHERPRIPVKDDRSMSAKSLRVQQRRIREEEAQPRRPTAAEVDAAMATAAATGGAATKERRKEQAV